MPILGIGIGIFHFLLARHPRGPFVGCPPTMAKVGGLAGPKALNKPCKSEMGVHIHLGAQNSPTSSSFLPYLWFEATSISYGVSAVILKNPMQIWGLVWPLEAGCGGLVGNPTCSAPMGNTMDFLGP